MKRRIILIVDVLAILIVMAVMAHALIYSPLKQEISSAGYVAVELPAGFGCNSFTVWTEDRSGYYLASQANGSDGVFHPDGMPISIRRPLSSSTSAQILCYAKGAATTNLVGHFDWK